MSTLSAIDANAATTARFFHFCWAPPALLVLARSGGAKLVTLAATLGVDRKSVKRGVAELVEMGLVRDNPGHGHPMRPEYLPTRDGLHVGAAWERLLRALTDLNAQVIAQTKWGVPVLALIDAGAGRFGDLQGATAGLTPRALAIALRGLTAAGLVTRTIEEGFPPRVLYTLRPGLGRMRRALAVFRRVLGRQGR